MTDARQSVPVPPLPMPEKAEAFRPLHPSLLFSQRLPWVLFVPNLGRLNLATELGASVFVDISIMPVGAAKTVAEHNAQRNPRDGRGHRPDE